VRGAVRAGMGGGGVTAYVWRGCRRRRLKKDASLAAAASAALGWRLRRGCPSGRGGGSKQQATAVW